MSFDEFYRKHFDQLRRFVIRMGARAEEAEEVVQEVMFQAYLKWNTIEKPLHWSYRAVKSVFIRVVTRRRREEETLRAAGLERPVPPEPSSEQTERVRELLRALPPAQREVFALTHDGYTPTDIADILGKTSDTVRANLREARRRLRQLLEGESDV